jgi:hypothetical protein
VQQAFTGVATGIADSYLKYASFAEKVVIPK